jgi:hypothetical protein
MLKVILAFDMAGEVHNIHAYEHFNICQIVDGELSPSEIVMSPLKFKME